jgi:nitrite reductase/ring-hydroxylating ferredoxin subunit
MPTAMQVYVCETDELADGQFRRVDGDPSLIVYRVAGEFFATQELCTHEEWSLAESEELEGYEIECSLHLARFDVRTGGPSCLPATRSLTTYPVEVVGGRVYVHR